MTRHAGFRQQFIDSHAVVEIGYDSVVLVQSAAGFGLEDEKRPVWLCLCGAHLVVWPCDAR